MARCQISTVEDAAKPLWQVKRTLAKALRVKNRTAATSALEGLLRIVCSTEHPAVRTSAERAFKDYFAACPKAGISQLYISMR